jgi:hypothetical protein
MFRGILFSSLLCLASVSGFAHTWAGYLVKSSCFQNEQQNRNSTNTEYYVNTDVMFEIRYCAPSVRTSEFGFVDANGIFYKLDPASNAQAAALVRRTGKMRGLPVTVNGEVEGKVLHIQSVGLR